MYNTRCIHVRIHRQYIWHYPDSNVRSCLVFQYSPASTVPNNMASMGNLIRFLLPVCGLHGNVVRNHLTKSPESPINPSGQADLLKAWNQRICIIRNASIPTFVRDTILNLRQDLLLMMSWYFTTPGGRVYIQLGNIPTLRTTHITICHPCGCWHQYVHCEQFHSTKQRLRPLTTKGIKCAEVFSNRYCFLGNKTK